MESKSLETTEAECAEGRTAPRVSLSDIKTKIISEYYYNAGDLARSFKHPEHASLDVLTICLVVLDNGFTIIGKSAPASADNFDEALGQKLAYEDAVRQIWPLMGFALREHLQRQVAEVPPAHQPPLPDA